MSVRLGLLLAAVVVAAIAANIALLSVATGRHDPVGTLSPIVAVGGGSSSPPSVVQPSPPPATTDDHGEPDD